MKHILLVLFALTSFLASSQTWKNIGSTAGMNATEVDMEIDQNTGTLFMAYVSTTGTNRIVVRKWQNNAWTNVGVAFGASNATDLKLTILGNGNPAVAYKTVVSTYTTVDTYKFNGTSWSAIGFQDQFSIDANKGITLKSVGTSDLVVSFFNLIGQSFNITNNQLIVLKMNGNMWEMIGSDQELYDVTNYDMSGNVDVTGSALNNLYTAFGEDQSSNFESFKYTTFWAGAGTVAYDNPKNIILKQNLTNTFGAGYTTALVSSKYYLKYKAFNGTAYGAEIRVDSNTTAEISEWDMDGMYGSYIFFYKKGNTAYVKSVSGSTVASLGSGTPVAPTA